MQAADFDIMALYVSFIFVLMISMEMMKASFDSCDNHLSLRGPEMAALINRTYPTCNQINFTRELPVCQIDNENTVDTCYGHPGRLSALPACPDGTWNRTCYPRTSDDMKDIECVCHSSVQFTGDIRETDWEKWKKLEPPVNGAHYRRRLVMDSECIGQEFIKLPIKPIVARHSLPDSVYTASSYYQNDAAKGPYRARIDKYFNSCCGWAAGNADTTNPWLAITLPTGYSVRGMKIKKRCDAPYTSHYITMVTVSTSDDDVTYQDVVVREDLSAGYDADLTAYIVFTQDYTTRFWVIHVNAYNSYPAMKCDLFGFEE